MQSPDEWFSTVPPVTKAYFVCAVVTTLAVTVGIFNPYYMYLDYDLILRKFQFWRLVTNFFFFGKLSMGSIFSLVILVRYGSQLESRSFPGFNGLCAYTWLYTVGMSCLLFFGGFVFGMSFLGPAMIFMILYIWSRKDPHQPTAFYGFRFEQWHVPFVMLFVSMLLGGDVVSDILGILVGHLWIFLTDIVPRVYAWNGLHPTPQFISRLYSNYLPKVAAFASRSARVSGGGPIRGEQAPPRPSHAWMRGPGHRLDE